MKAFYDLYRETTHGQCGVDSQYNLQPGVTITLLNCNGIVFWKNHSIEHYKIPWVYTGEGKKFALNVAHRCKIIEIMGEIPTIEDVIWNWNDTLNERDL